jgi:hypothetical protein
MAQSDCIILIDEINAWFSLRIKKLPSKGAWIGV